MNAITSPQHYTSLPAKCSGCGKPIECIDVTKHMIGCRSAAVKYIWRAGQKGDEIEDLRKAIQYLEFEIGRLKEAPADASDPDPFARIDAAYAALSEKPAESGLWPPVAGKCGWTRRMGKAGPMVWDERSEAWSDRSGRLWREDGKNISSTGSCLDDLVSERVQSLWFKVAGKRTREGWKADEVWQSVAPSTEEPPLEMREGAWYMRRDGQVKGPAEARPWAIGSQYPWDINGRTYANDGSYYIGEETKRDLIREVSAPEASE